MPFAITAALATAIWEVQGGPRVDFDELLGLAKCGTVAWRVGEVHAKDVVCFTGR